MTDENDNRDLAADEAYEESATASEDAHTVNSRNKLREEMQSDIERFLQSGGKIEQVPIHVNAERNRNQSENLGEASQ